MFRYKDFAETKIPMTIGQDKPISPQQDPSTSEDSDVDVLNAQDALQPITDEISNNPLLWIFEIVPTLYAFQSLEGKWVTTFG